MRSALGGPSVLLRRLREIMAEPVSAQARLDKIVTIIAVEYGGGSLLFLCACAPTTRSNSIATEGLKREAVHITTMKAGEGLVGLIAQQAEPLNLSRRAESSGLLLQA